jgi:hypothetical protein
MGGGRASTATHGFRGKAGSFENDRADDERGTLRSRDEVASHMGFRVSL